MAGGRLWLFRDNPARINGWAVTRGTAMSTTYTRIRFLLPAALGGALLGVAPGAASLPAPEDPRAAKVVSLLLGTDFSRQCDLSTYPLKQNLAYLFENKYIGLEFRSWEVEPAGKPTYRVELRYVDGKAGPTKARWQVDMDGETARLGGENAEVLSCMTGYL